MKIHCARHGQTHYNLSRLCNDDPSRDVALTPLGRDQAASLAQRLKAEPLQRILHSELPRTRQTAEIINRHHGLPLECDPRLNDIRSGFESRGVEEYFAATAHDSLNARVNGGESLLDHKARIMGFIAWLVRQPEDCLLVVAHEETLRVFDAWQRGLPDERLRELHYANTELLTFEVD